MLAPRSLSCGFRGRRFRERVLAVGFGCFWLFGSMVDGWSLECLKYREPWVGLWLKALRSYGHFTAVGLNPKPKTLNPLNPKP